MAFDPTADTAPLAALHAACFQDAWDAASLRTTLAAPGAFAFHDRDGFVVARVAGDEAEILTLAVTPGARGKGLGIISMEERVRLCQGRLQIASAPNAGTILSAQFPVASSTDAVIARQDDQPDRTAGMYL